MTTDTKDGALERDIVGTRARIEELQSELRAAEMRLAKLRGVEVKQLQDQVKTYDEMTAEEQVRLRTESPSTFTTIMDAKREAGERRLMDKQVGR